MVSVVDQVSCDVHWLRFSTHAALEAVVDAMPGDWPLKWFEGRGGYNQPASVESSVGVRVFHGKPERVIVVECDGTTCEGRWQELVAGGLKIGGRVTRCDLAVDLYPEDLARQRLLAVHRQFRRNQALTRLAPGSLIVPPKDSPDGYTFYMGSRASELFFRLYDRRGPLRWEIEWKPQNKQMKAMVLQMLQDNGAMSIWRSLMGVVQFPKLQWFQNLMAGDVAVMPGQTKEPSEADRRIKAAQWQCGSLLWWLNLQGSTDLVMQKPYHPRGRELKMAADLARYLRSIGRDGDAIDEAIKCMSDVRSKTSSSVGESGLSLKQ